MNDKWDLKLLGEIPQVVASERGGGQTGGFILRGCGQTS